MNTELFTLSKIFMESIYRIPDYQRGYSWKDEQLKDFWLDLEQLQDDKRHYTGVLTLEPVPETTWSAWADDRWIIKSRRYKPYYVVDGQQRLTTAIILLQCILECTDKKQLNFTSTEDIRRKYIFDSKPDELARCYLFGYEKDNPSYEFLKRHVFCETSDHHAPDEDTIYTKNLAYAKAFFCELLSKLNGEEIEVVFTKLTQQLVFNVYEIADDIDVFVSFETMNNRGKPLSTLELLKNRLIFLSTRISSSDEGNGDNLRRAINDAWKTTYHYLGKNERRPLGDDDFLRAHLTHYYPTALQKIPVPTDEAYDKANRRFHISVDYFNRFLLNEVFTTKRVTVNAKTEDFPALSRRFIYDYAQDIKKSVEIIYKTVNPNDSSFPSVEKIWLERIGRLTGFEQSSLLLAVYSREKESKKRALFLENYERWLFCNTLLSRTGGYGRIPSFGNFFIEYVCGRNSITEITIQLDNMVVQLFHEGPLSELISDWVRGGLSYYGWRSIKYFLFEYEVELQEACKSDRQKINWDDFSSENYKGDYDTIEHIYPQRARDPYWVERFSKFSTPHKKALRNSLGNLLALSKPRNSSLGNRSFAEKLGDDQKKTGYRYGSYSENEVAVFPEWTADQIVERGLRLLDFMERRWKVRIGDRSAKMKSLGLEFMDNPTTRKRF